MCRLAERVELLRDMRVPDRLTGATRRRVADDRRAWVKQLRTLQKACTSGKPTTSIEEILAETREDRGEPDSPYFLSLLASTTEQIFSSETPP